MAENPKSRLAKTRKRLAVPRELYLAAVERQEHRVWARRTDPRRDAEMQMLLNKVKNQLLLAEGKEPDQFVEPEPVGKPDPAVFDTEDQISSDDALIQAYISDNPDEHRLPNARGRNHAELLKFWHSSLEGQRYHVHLSRELKPKLEEFRVRILSDGK